MTGENTTGFFRRGLARVRYSLAARLMLLFIVTGIVLGIIVSFSFGFALRKQFDTNLRPHLEQYLEYIHRDLGDPPSIDRARHLTDTLPVEIQINGPDVNWSSLGADIDPRDIVFRRRHAHRGRDYGFGDIGERVVLKTLSGEHAVYLIMQGRRGEDRRFGLLPLLLILLVLYGSYRGIRWLLRPVEDIQAGVKLIGQGQLDQRVRVRRKDDLGDLSRSINDMAGEIERILEAKRQLLLAVSHELRSPITRARVSTELLPPSDAKSEIDADLKEMQTILTELLETERLNTPHGVLNLVRTAANRIIVELVDQQHSSSTVRTNLSAPDVLLSLDETRFKLLVKNLVDNAVRYNRPAAGPVRIETSHDAQRFVLKVSDQGAGIDPAHLPHLTEPFYRVDPARRRETGGYGLGLYLCRIIAEAHGGALSIDSEPGRGTVITVTLPIR